MRRLPQAGWQEQAWRERRRQEQGPLELRARAGWLARLQAPRGRRPAGSAGGESFGVGEAGPVVGRLTGGQDQRSQGAQDEREFGGRQWFHGKVSFGMVKMV